MIFITFGSHPAISLAECASLFPKEIRPETATEHGCFVDLPESEALNVMNRVAMSIKVVGKISEPFPKDQLLDQLKKYVIDNTEKERIIFGSSVYNAGNNKLTDSLERQMPRTCLSLKKQLKESGTMVRVVSGKLPRLSSVQVETNHLLDRGAEIVMLATPKGVRLGVTLGVQNFKSWSKRDFGRPAGDAKSGMLPPKVARMLVSLTGADPKTDTVFDPFCGSGTVLMEAAVMGFTRLLGSDISEKATGDTEANFAWLKTHWPNMYFPDLLTIDAGQLPNDFKNRFNTIAGEVYLGTPQSKRPPTKQAEHQARELMVDYKRIFRHLFDLARPGTHFVVAFPAFSTQEEPVFLPLKEMLSEIGFIIDNPLPETTPEKLKQLSPSGGLIYKRPTQFVWRDIMVFQKPE